VECKRIVTIADETKADLMRLYNLPASKISVLKPGIREDLEPKPKPDNVFRIGYLGQLDHRKRVGLLVEAFKQTDIKGELVIAGSGPDRQKLKAMADGDSRIKFLGFIPDDKICDFYNSLDLFCFPTMVEGLGLPIIEAMACGKDVEIQEDCIIPKILKERCYFDGFDALSSVKTKVENYQFAKTFTWYGFIDGLEKVYSEVLNG
jgi:glycosyltransferase involved in cell wall biosynthesis